MKYSVLLATTAILSLTGAAFAQGAEHGEAGTTTGQRFLNEHASSLGAIVTLSPSAVRLVQQRLNQIGYDAGNLTGNWDQQTQAATRRYQEANNLEPTGTLTLPTLNCMGGRQGGTSLLSGRYVGTRNGNHEQRFLNERAQAQGARIMASPAQVRLVQQRLNQLGYNSGNLSGKWDHKTSEAARLFQEANNLEPTGQLDVALITRLGGNRVIFGASCHGNGGGVRGTTTSQRFLNERANASGEPIYFSPASVRLIQQALNQAGFNAGNLTGNWDQQTQRATALFQKANNLAPTGSLTTSMLARLDMPNWYTGQVLRYNPALARRNNGGGGNGGGNLSASNGGGNGNGGGFGNNGGGNGGGFANNGGGNGGGFGNNGGGNGGGFATNGGANNGRFMNETAGNGGNMNNGGNGQTTGRSVSAGASHGGSNAANGNAGASGNSGGAGNSGGNNNATNATTAGAAGGNR